MNIFQMSVSASVLILAVVVIRALAINKLPKKTFLVLWGLTLCRLLIPFSLPSRFSVYTLFEWVSGFFTQTPNAQINAETVPITDTMTEWLTPSLPLTAPTAQTAISPLMAVWLVGLTLCSVFFAVTHIRWRNKYCEAMPTDCGFIDTWLRGNKLRRVVRIRQSDRIAAPLTYGIWNPVILLPKTTDWQDETRLRYILAHELTHIKRFDIFLKWLLAAAACVHWFNPLVWVMYALANRDIELSCDEAVVREFGETAKSAYALTLIKLEEKKLSFSPLSSGFSKNSIEERIVSIMKIKKTSFAAMLAALIIVVGVTTAFATSAASTNLKTPEDTTEATTLQFPEDTVLTAGEQTTYGIRDDGNDAAVINNGAGISSDENIEVNLLYENSDTGEVSLIAVEAKLIPSDQADYAKAEVNLTVGEPSDSSDAHLTTWEDIVNRYPDIDPEVLGVVFTVQYEGITRLIAVNHSDESKLSADDWKLILKAVELGLVKWED